jgi:hypothetical protein
MAFWTKIYSLFRQPTKHVNLKEAKYLPYFDDYDNFPLKWHQSISESPSATACVSTIQDFLEGFGFSDPELEKRVVNSRGETLFQIHQKTCKDFGEFEGFAWHFIYNSYGQITDWYVLPFENVRLMKPDDNGYINKILYNPYFGTSDYQNYKRDTIFYDVFSPSEVQKQIDVLGDKRNTYKGQVLFVGTTTALSRFYPLPEAYAAIKWMGTEKGIADYHEDNINNGFLQPFMLAMIGDPNAPVNNPEATSTETQQTVAEAFDEMISNNFMGAKRVGNMMVTWFANENEIPKPVAFPSNNSGDLFLSIDQQSTKKITIAFKVPAILANINEGVSLGGDGNTVRVAVKLMQQRVIKKQRLLTDSYQTILRKMSNPYVQEVFISPYNPYPELEIIDDKIWQEMSPEERRDWIEKNTEIELFDGVVTPTTPTPTEARISNAIPLGWPESIRKKIKKALDYHDKMGIKCVSRGGRAISEAVVNNNNLGLKDLKRIYNYLSKRKEFENRQYSEGCDAISYHAWGGEEMEKFLEGKLKDVDQWLN